MSEYVIETRDLKKYFKSPHGVVHAVDGIDMRVKRGETLGIVGESGCGKSTLARLLLRLIDATSGEIYFNGENILDYRPKKMKETRKQIQIIFQDPYASLNPRLSVSEIISEPLRNFKDYENAKDLQQKVMSVMDKVGLDQRFFYSYPHELDGGRRQRIGIARALILQPEVIVCDEPVSALDVSVQAQILNLLMDLQEQMGLTYVFISHDLSVVKHISDNIMVMYLGKCVELAPSEKIFKNPAHPYTQALLDSILLPSSSQKGKKLPLIKGELTGALDPDPGCRFAPRCKWATDACKADDIPLEQIRDAHHVACLRWKEVLEHNASPHSVQDS
ncbi:MAG: ABC transporter ATP-binding protein [Saccharofermentanales bacterium]|jgi:oligopeptide/dipeptide ABC transporter ATP-binding protein